MSIRSKNNQDLILRIKQRDVREFEHLYNTYMPILHKFAFRYSYDSEVAKDLVHDAFMWLWNNPEKISPSGSIKGLLYNLVKSNCLNYLRSLDIEDRNNMKYSEAASASMSFTIDDDNCDDESIRINQRLRHILDSLPQKGRMALEMHIVKNMKIKAIAECMNIEESTVKTHLKRAMSILRKNMMYFFM